MNKRFNAFHPAINFSYYLGAIAILMLLMHPLFLLVSLTILISIHFFNDRCKNFNRWLFFMVTTGLLIVIMNPLFNERGHFILFEVMGHRITIEAIIYGSMSALSIISVMVIFVSYNEVMSPNKLLYLFSKFLPQFAILLMLTLRFIPLMRRRLEEISAVQMSKGQSVQHGPWKARIKNGMLYVQVLVTYSLEGAIQTADSMEARGYGLNKRTTYEYFRFKKSDTIVFIYLMGLFLIILYGRFLGFGFLKVYPVMESMNLQPMEFGLLVIEILFLSFPLFVELGEMVRWRISN
jgi:energy-coupling factor transport system permease protein